MQRSLPDADERLKALLPQALLRERRPSGRGPSGSSGQAISDFGGSWPQDFPLQTLFT